MHRSQEPPNQRHLKDGKCESYLHHAHQMTMVEVTSASASAQVHHSVPRNSASVVACHVESAWGCSDRVAAVCLDMSGHVSGHVRTQPKRRYNRKKRQNFRACGGLLPPAAPAASLPKPCFNIHWVTLTVSGALFIFFCFTVFALRLRYCEDSLQ